MIDIEKLEKRWWIYQIKKQVPYAIFIVFFLLIYVLFLIFLTIKEDYFSSKHLIKKKTQKVVQQPLRREVIVEPSFAFLTRMQNDLISQRDIPQRVPPVKQVLKKDIKIVKHKKNKEQNQTIVSNVPKKKEKKVFIMREKNGDLKDVLQRFQENQNPALGLFIARKYYKLKEYQKAYNYALETNKINSQVEESWIIFAKSLYHLQQKQKALEVLQQYIQNNGDSPKIRELYDAIQRGTLQ
ncbi:Transformation system protein [hydrothermal vent metagenome]|uniref:Transformation system protein n=1 Tax=hydrothermal vent metagenome TaxID=652676 RepID=A0A1W1D506_9ZZZZ